MKFRLSTIRYAALPLLAAGSVGVAIGPAGWKALSAWFTGVCRSVISDMGPVEIGLWSALLIATAAAVAATWSAARLARRHALFSRVLRARLRDSREWGSGEERRYFVFSDEAPTAFCNGVIHPQIYVSDSLIEMLTPHELEAVLEHELIHKRRMDPLRIALIRVACGAFALVPLVRSLGDRYLLSLELRADREALLRVAKTQMIGALAKLLNGTRGRLNPVAASGFDHVGVRLEALAGTEGDAAARIPWLSRKHVTAALVWAALVVAGWSYTVWGAAAVLATAPWCRMQL